MAQAAIPQTSADVRRKLVEALQLDLVGPSPVLGDGALGDPAEVLTQARVSPRNSTTSSDSISIRLSMLWFSRSMVPNPSPRSHPTRPAAQKGTRPNDDPDYKRTGTTTLFAALNTLDGSVMACPDTATRNGCASCA